MPQSLDISIKTLTPLWTGGVDGTCDRLHISGLMGSLRYWYEAIVRGVGGYACDPSDPSEGQRCTYKPRDERDPEHTGLKSICAACYLFGTTGWARLFRLTAMVGEGARIIEAREPLHFRTFNDMNARWLTTIYEGVDQGSATRPSIALQHSVYLPDAFSLRFVWRGYESEYAKQQVLMLFWLLSTHAGLGAKQQFGFGQIKILSPLLSGNLWNEGLGNLKRRQNEWLFLGTPERPLPPAQRVSGHATVPPPNLEHFFAVSSTIPGNAIGRRVKVGQIPSSMANLAHNQAPRYLASAFDIRYKGDNGSVIGLRRYLDARNPTGKGWNHQALNGFLGASRLRGEPEIIDEERNASRVFVTMPYQIGDSENFHLRLYGFALSNLLTPDGNLTAEKAAALCNEYLTSLQATTIPLMLGSDLLKEAHA